MSNQQREVRRIIEPQAVLEGAGVRLKRSIATATLDNLDPFLLFDHFGSKDPADYIKGFPMHPHRGIETVTYMIQGVVNHKDSIGNSGSIRSGDVQWMTSGGGIMHEEMPQAGQDEMIGFQLWVNLPARLKMGRPRYQEIFADQIPRVTRADGVEIRVIAGTVDEVRGPVTEIEADPVYLDINVPPNGDFKHPVKRAIRPSPTCLKAGACLTARPLKYRSTIRACCYLAMEIIWRSKPPSNMCGSCWSQANR